MKKLLITASEFLASAAIVSTGLYIGGPIGEYVVAALGIHFGGGILEKHFDGLKERWLSSEDGVLNHDIQRALLRAYVKALLTLEEKYFDLPKAALLSSKQSNSIKWLFTYLRERADDTFLPSLSKSSTKEEVREYLYLPPEDARAKLWEHVDAKKAIYANGTHFGDFFERNILEELQTCFSEELKHDNKESNRAWRAFQRMLLEGIRTDIQDLKSTQEEIRENLEKLNSSSIDREVLDHIVRMRGTIQDVAATATRTELKLDSIALDLKTIIETTPQGHFRSPTGNYVEIEQTRPAQVFISYGREDLEFVNRLAADLEELKLNIWYDVKLNPGDKLAAEIEKALRAADYCLVVLTNTSVHKDWVENEYTIALELAKTLKRPRVIPVRLGTVDLPLRLSHLVYADFGLEYTKGLRQLRRILESAIQDKEIPFPSRLPSAFGPGSPDRPFSMPGYYSEVLEQSQPVPIDIGSAWGLQRSSFIGVCSDLSPLNVYGNLNSVERALSDALRGAEGVLKLPTRWWLEVDPRVYPNGPQSVQEVGASVKDQSDDRARYLKSDMLPDDVLPGLLIQLPATDPQLVQQSIETARLWCEALLNEIFPDRQLALVFQVTTGNDDQALKVAWAISEGLRSRALAAPLEIVCSSHLHPNQKESEDSESHHHILDPFATPASSLGSDFFSWIDHIHSNKNNWATLRAQREDYKQVVDLYLLLKNSNQAVRDPAVLSHADDVITDLDKLTPIYQKNGMSAVATDLDRQFLNLVREYLPELYAELVLAYSKSKRGYAQRIALAATINNRHQLSNRWDENLEAFLSTSVKSRANSAREPGLLDAHVGVPGPVLDTVVQSLLRRYWHRRRDDTKTLIEGVLSAPGLGEATRAVCRLFLSHINVKQFLSSQGKEAYLIAWRAGYDFDFSLNELEGVNIESTDLWALLTALPMSFRRAAELLRLDKSQRAVFGLITVDEWRQMQGDSDLVDKVLTGRQGRPLYFVNQA